MSVKQEPGEIIPGLLLLIRVCYLLVFVCDNSYIILIAASFYLTIMCQGYLVSLICPVLPTPHPYSSPPGCNLEISLSQISQHVSITGGEFNDPNSCLFVLYWSAIWITGSSAIYTLRHEASLTFMCCWILMHRCVRQLLVAHLGFWSGRRHVAWRLLFINFCYKLS